jgi:hypothetical protein
MGCNTRPGLTPWYLLLAYYFTAYYAPGNSLRAFDKTRRASWKIIHPFECSSTYCSWIEYHEVGMHSRQNTSLVCCSGSVTNFCRARSYCRRPWQTPLSYRAPGNPFSLGFIRTRCCSMLDITTFFEIFLGTVRCYLLWV